jgi:hypothetical protein
MFQVRWRKVEAMSPFRARLAGQGTMRSQNRPGQSVHSSLPWHCSPCWATCSSDYLAPSCAQLPCWAALPRMTCIHRKEDNHLVLKHFSPAIIFTSCEVHYVRNSNRRLGSERHFKTIISDLEKLDALTSPRSRAGLVEGKKETHCFSAHLS